MSNQDSCAYIASTSSHVMVSRSRMCKSFRRHRFASSPPNKTRVVPTRVTVWPPRETYIRWNETYISNWTLILCRTFYQSLHIQTLSLNQAQTNVMKSLEQSTQRIYMLKCKNSWLKKIYYRWFSISPDNRPGTSMRIKFLH